MKKFLMRLTLLLPILLIISALNFMVDPANIFGGQKIEKKIAEHLLNGSNVGNATDFDERLLQKFYIESLKETKDVVVLGSSRSLQIRSVLFPDKKFFNNSVSWGVLEDYISVYEMYEVKGYKPEVIVLGLDPWIFNKNNGISSWKAIGNYYTRFNEGDNSFYNKNLRGLVFKIQRYSEIFSPSYFQGSLTFLAKNINKRNQSNQIYPTDKTKDINDIKLVDGSLSYNSKFELINADDALKEAKQSIRGDAIATIKSFNKIDQTECLLFEKFVKHLKDKGIKLIFFFPPYHPYVYDYLTSSNDYKIINDVEEYFKKIAIKNNVESIGSYNPNLLGLKNEDFYDGLHLKTEAIKKVFQKLGVE